MLNAWTMPGNKTGDLRIRIHPLDQNDDRKACFHDRRDHRRARTVRMPPLDDLKAEIARIPLYRCFEIIDCDRHMID